MMRAVPDSPRFPVVTLSDLRGHHVISLAIGSGELYDEDLTRGTSMGDVDRHREQLDAANAGALSFPGHHGCAGTRPGGPGPARPCTAQPIATVVHRVEHPRPRTERLFVCEAHAVGHIDPRLLTADDRAELRRRRAALTRRADRRRDGRAHAP